MARLPAPHQLPPSTRQFVGRDTELAQLTELLTQPRAGAVIAAIDGTAGIGKTALAMTWAHQVRDRFPDGELHVNLRGFDEQDPLDTSQVLDGFLQTLGVHPQAIPAGRDAKSALYRSMLAERRMLVVLDNARSSDHVRPLLPASPISVAVVTSRNRLDGLLVREGAHRIALDVLSDADALALIAERIDRTRLEEDPGSAAELVRLCAHLPLALSVAAARAANQSPLSLRELLGELRDERHRLDALDLGEPDLNLRAVFSWSYSELPPTAARLFRLLGMHPGADIGLAACRALADDNAPAALRKLTSAHLLTEYRPGRFRLHDLLRAYATELAAADPERAAAAARLVAHYLDTALLAERHILPHRYGRDALVGRPPLDQAEIGDVDDAMDWFTLEHPTLLTLVGFAADHDLTGHAWRLAWACTTFLRRTGRWSERAAVHRAALAATIRTDDRLGEATSSRNLATAVARLGELDEAVRLLSRAAELCEELGDEISEFKTHLACVRVLSARSCHVEALKHAERAWELIRGRHDRLGHADALAAMAGQLAAVHRDDEARPLGTRAFELYTAIGHVEGQAYVLIVLGDIERALDRPAEAVEYYRRSHSLDRRLGDRYWRAVSAEKLAEVYPDDDDRERSLREALATYREIRHPAAERVEVRLRTLMASADGTRAPAGETPTC
nr:AAA family ATPase [Amycolatopsis umgeniensis]